MNRGAGQDEGCRTALQNVRRQCDVRRTVWPLSEQPSDTTPATHRQLAAGGVRGPADPAEVAVARVLTRSGTWVVLHGVPLSQIGPLRVAVIVEPAHPARIAPLLMSAYRLTEREQELTRLMLQGFSTAEIAERLVISVHTVQQHLKNVFDKTGVRSRRELVTKILLAHYEPRLRDNERRVAADHPVRGGPSRSRLEQLRRSGPKSPAVLIVEVGQKAVGRCGP
jgi:DNA-binding CsgD family transcriptional regulator